MAISLRSGEVVDRYTVEALLGEGGMAAVYAVRHNTLGSSHALKLLKIESEAIRQRLVAEGKVQASLRHPNIVAVTDVLLVNGQPGLLMERIEGPALDHWLGTYRPTVDEGVKLFRGILAGVARAHRAGLVHRDLKPGNVLLDSADGLVIPKVADFGLAKILADEESGHSQTRSGFAMGTPQFMAPEQIRSAKDVDQRADIFALGCILYVLVCGQLPFEAPDILELYNRIATGRYTDPESLVPGLPKRVGDTIRACLAVERDQRPPDCDAVRRMLYGDDDSLAGGVKIDGVSDLRPARRAERLVAAATRVEDGSLAASAPVNSVPVTPPSAHPRSPTNGTGGLPWKTIGLVAGGVALLVTVAVASAMLAVGMKGGDTEAASTTTAVPAPMSAPAATPTPAPEPAPPATAAAPAVATTSAPSAAPAATAPPTSASASTTSRRSTTKARAATEAPAEPVATGSLRVSGSVESLKLHAGGRSYAPGTLPAGTYEARYNFADRPEQTLTGVQVRAGSETVIGCDARFAKCKVQ